MNVKVCANYEAMSKGAADWITRELTANPRLLICLPTGSSPTRTYDLLSERARKSPKLFAQMRVLKLDEWGGLPPGDPGSCKAYLQRHVVGPWGISRSRYEGFSTDARKSKSECKRIQGWLARNGPIDLCILGLGPNGHLGLNEPGDSLCPVAHRAKLLEETRDHPMLTSGIRPEFGLTLGIAEILQARKILLLVSGAHKRKAFQRLAQKEITTQFPASLLWMHSQTTIICDRAAAVGKFSNSK